MRDNIFLAAQNGKHYVLNNSKPASQRTRKASLFTYVISPKGPLVVDHKGPLRTIGKS